MGGVSDAKFFVHFIWRLATVDAPILLVYNVIYLKIVSHINNIKLENKQKTHFI